MTIPHKEKTMKLARIAVLVVALGATAAFIGVGLPEGAHGSADQAGRTITVNGSGTVSTVPDQAQFCFGVENRADSPEQASGANAADAAALIKALKDAGVASKNLQTQSVSVTPEYNDAETKVIGYLATNSICATTSVADAGATVDAAMKGGADRVDGPTLTKAESEKLYDDALRAAVANARGRAQVLADAAGVEVGEVFSIDETSEPSGPIAYDMALTAAPTPVEPGTQDVEATVTVTFVIA